MSEKNRDGRRPAVERLHEERRRQENRDRRMRALGILGGVVTVVAVAGVAGYLMGNRGGESEPTRTLAVPAGAGGKGRLVISVGETDAPATLDVYEDFRCPACGAFEAEYHKTVDKLVSDGKVRVDYHLASFIDRNVGGSGSRYAANAAACAQDFGAFAEYHRVLFDHQPPETEDDFGQKDRLIELAQKVPALKANKHFDTCVDDGVYDGWVARSQEAFDESGFNSTPTVLLNGKDIFADGKKMTPGRLAKAIEAAGKKKAPSPSQSAEPSAGSSESGTPGAPAASASATSEDSGSPSGTPSGSASSSSSGGTASSSPSASAGQSE